MIIGSFSVIPEDVLLGEMRWIPEIGYLVIIHRSDKSILMLTTTKEAEAKDWLKKIDTAIAEGSANRAALAQLIIEENERD